MAGRNSDLEVQVAVVETLRQIASQAEDDLVLAQSELAHMVKKECVRLGKLPEEHHLEIGTWECESHDNPFHKCVFDDNEDPANDFCLFCGQPEERQ